MDGENQFVLPEEYKSTQSLQGVNSIAELCKKFVENESFIGKLKSERAIPNETDGDDIWNQFIGKKRAIVEKQDFNGIDESIAKVLKDSGIAKQEAKPLLDFLKAENDKRFDGEEWNRIKKDKFVGKEKLVENAETLLGRLSDEVKSDLKKVPNEVLAFVYSALGETADIFAVKEPIAPTNNGSAFQPTNSVYNADGSLNNEAFSKMQDEMIAVGNVPDKQERKDAIMKKWGY